MRPSTYKYCVAESEWKGIRGHRPQAKAVRFVGARWSAVCVSQVARGGRSKRKVWKERDRRGENARTGEVMEAGCVINLGYRGKVR